MSILVNEADPNAREIPFHLPDANDPRVGITGHAWLDVGGGLTNQLQFRLPGGAYQNAAIANIVEKGFGDYAMRLTQAQTSAVGSVYLYASVPAAQIWTSEERISAQASAGIVLGSALDAERELAFHLPDIDNPLVPVTGHVFVTGEVKICLPGGIYTDADVTRVVEKGHGDYALQLTNAQVSARGKLFLRVLVAGAQEWTGWNEIVPQFVAGGPLSAPTITNLTPAKSVLPGGPGAFSSSYSVARATPIEFDLANIAPGAGILISIKFKNRSETYAILDTTEPAADRWKWPFDAFSAIGDLLSEPVHVSLLPRDGWPPVPWAIKVAAIKPAVEP